MPPVQVPPIRDLEEASLDEITGRYLILDDLHAEFQGAALGYPFFAMVLLLLSLATGYYRWSENNTAIQLQLTLIPFTALMAVSLHSWVWLLRIRRRRNVVRRRMAALGAREPLTEEIVGSLAKPL
jgi:hypothetical protein